LLCRESAEDLITVRTAQDHITEDQRPVTFAEMSEGLFRVSGLTDGPALGYQNLRDEAAYLRLVVYYHCVQRRCHAREFIALRVVEILAVLLGLARPVMRHGLRPHVDSAT
jgi:hypothetical protein